MVKVMKKQKKRSQIGAIWFRFQKNKLALISTCVLGVFILLILTTNIYMDPLRVSAQNPMRGLELPSKDFPLGTDSYGRDMLARIIYGGRISLTAGFFAVVAAMIVGGLLGASAGYFGGVVDNIVMRVMDILMAIPPMLLAITVVAALGANTRNLVIALAISRISSFSRVVRASVLPLRNQEYIEAALACGTSNWRIITRHIIPNVLGPVLVQATLQMGHTIIQIAGLSFVGLGIQPPTPEWGSMLADAREYMRSNPYLVFPPGVAIMITVFCFNRIGDGLRDALDPKLKN